MYDESVQTRFTRIAAHLDEKTKRLWCANEALALGRGHCNTEPGARAGASVTGRAGACVVADAGIAGCSR